MNETVRVVNNPQDSTKPALVAATPISTSSTMSTSTTMSNVNINSNSSCATKKKEVCPIGGTKRLAHQANIPLATNAAKKNLKLSPTSPLGLAPAATGTMQATGQPHSMPPHIQSNASTQAAAVVPPSSSVTNCNPVQVVLPTLVSSLANVSGHVQSTQSSIISSKNKSHTNALVAVGAATSVTTDSKGMDGGRNLVTATAREIPAQITPKGNATVPTSQGQLRATTGGLNVSSTSQTTTANGVLQPGLPRTAQSQSLSSPVPSITKISTPTTSTTTSATSTTKQQQPLKQHTILAPLNRKNKNLSEKKIRRLEKNRLSARNCRRKKKEFTQNLQREINILEGENLRLRLQLQIGQEAEQLSKEEQNRVTEGLDALLKSGASDSEIFMNIEEFKEKYADYGRDRRSAIDFHLRNVERLLMPTTTTTVAMRVLDDGGGGSVGSANCNDATSDSGTQLSNNEGSSIVNTVDETTDIVAPRLEDGLIQSKETSSNLFGGSTTLTDTTQQGSKNSSMPPKSLFHYLVKYLQVTPNQAAALKDSRHVAKELDSALAQSLQMLQELRERLTQCTDDLDAEFTQIRSILTPRQAAKFLIWVANNGACMHMLNELWSRQYPEPVVEDESETTTGDVDSGANFQKVSGVFKKEAKDGTTNPI